VDLIRGKGTSMKSKLRLARKSPRPPATQIKLTVMLSPDAVEAVRKMAKKHRCTMTEVIGTAIGYMAFLVDHEDDHKFLLEARDGTLSTVKFA